MKLTPEQKASFEYGFEKGRLRMAIDTIRRRAWERHGARYGEVVFPVRELVWNEFNIKGIIACVRQKRASCRAWNPPDGIALTVFTVATVAASCLVRSVGDTVYGSRERRASEH